MSENVGKYLSCGADAMIVSLEDTYHTEYLFLPARKSNGMLQGLEVVINFIGRDNNVRAPAELVLPRLTEQETLMLFSEQLSLLESCKLFFIQHKLIAWINITPLVVDKLLQDEQLAAHVEKYPFLEFIINENYPGLNKGQENHSLVLLKKKHPLMLSNFGAGGASTKAIFDGLFHRVMLDKNFVHQRLTSRSFEPFMRAIVSQVAPYCEAVMIAGIDNENILARVAPFHFSAMQGALWPAVVPAHITTLVHP
ncbi:hypothetical protein [Vagococcus sp. WN89Y]|uniref:hypothetical protein n=1 Tax=Vagococcus sp. WN89Y TaxID=3457258 RepID=UPI003FCDB89A